MLAFNVPVMTPVRLLEIVPAVAMKLAEAVPPPTITETGTVSSPVLLERLTLAPLADAG